MKNENKINIITVLLSGIAFLFLQTNFAYSALVTSVGELRTPNSIIDFSQFEVVTGIPDLPSSLQVGDLVGEDIQLSGSGSIQINNGVWGLNTNGTWNSTDEAFARTSDYGVQYYQFNDGLVSGVGAFMNYTPGVSSNIFIRVLGEDLSMLEQYNITTVAPISTPGGTNDGGFRGIQRSTADIAGFSVEGSYFYIEDVTFTRAPVPIPSAAWLLGSGLVGLIGIKRKLRKG